jgi:hypothetical protein
MIICWTRSHICSDEDLIRIPGSFEVVVAEEIQSVET